MLHRGSSLVSSNPLYIFLHACHLSKVQAAARWQLGGRLSVHLHHFLCTPAIYYALAAGTQNNVFLKWQY
jgi:hypothetical protein